MSRLRLLLHVAFAVVFAVIVLARTDAALAQPPAAPAPAPVAQPLGRGVAVVATNGARDEAFALARAVYASRLRPPSLDEVRARVLAGDPPPANATRALVELAEVRAAARGDDAASRQLLAGLGKQVGAAALLVVFVEPAAPPAEGDAGATAAGPDGGAATEADAAAPSSAPAPSSRVVARLFLVDSADFDAARYEPDGRHGAEGWRATVASLEQRFPQREAAPAAATSPPPVTVRTEEKHESKPFYASPWFWGALGAAVLVGGAFYFASRDNESDTIHLQMRAPR
jgi:hypothetical protein